jgi:hypothetical protein
MGAKPATNENRWSGLTRQDLVALGKTLVTERLEAIGCTVTPPTARLGGRLTVQTPSGKVAEVFVSTQRLGGYVFWTKRRLQLAANRFAGVVVLTEAEEPLVYLVPSLEWSHATPPLKDRDNIGRRSEPEYGISMARSSLPSLSRYAWDLGGGAEHFR